MHAMTESFISFFQSIKLILATMSNRIIKVNIQHGNQGNTPKYQAKTSYKEMISHCTHLTGVVCKYVS